MPTGGGGGGGSPKGWPLTYFTTSTVDAAITLNTINQTMIWGFALPYSLTFGHITLWIQTLDAGNNYDFGIYSQAGALLANIGAQTFPSATQLLLPTVQAAQTLNPGLYLVAWTGTAQVGKIYGQPNFPGCWVQNNTAAVSAGGALPASIGAQTVAPIRGMPWFGLY